MITLTVGPYNQSNGKIRALLFLTSLRHSYLLRLADLHLEFGAIVFAMGYPIRSLSVSVERPTHSRRTGNYKDKNYKDIKLINKIQLIYLSVQLNGSERCGTFINNYAKALRCNSATSDD